MAVSAGDAYLDVHSRLAQGFGREMSRQVQGPATRAGEEASRHFGRKFAAGLAVGGALIGAGLYKATRAAVRGLGEATKAASDLNETVNKVNVIFGKSAPTIQKWARGSATAMGLSRQEALANAAAFGDMFLQLKLGRGQAVGMSERMVKLAADFASFHNADITQVLEAQQSAFRGEYDALQRFVPGINAARVEQEALRLSHKASAKDLTQAEKAQAAYNIMLKDGRRATGDFARTSQENANQQRIARAQWLDLKAILGKGFLPAQLAVTRAFTEKLLPAGQVLAREFGPRIGRVISDAARRLAAMVPPADQLADRARLLGERFSDLGPRMGETFRRVRTQVAPTLQQLRTDTGRIGPALEQAGGGGRVFANSLTIVAPVLDVVARNIHNILPWLPTLLAGFLAFRAVRNITAPVREFGQAIANFTSPAIAVATFLNARASRALAAAYREQAAAAIQAGTAQGGLTATTTAGGVAAQTAAGRWAMLRGALSAVLLPLAAFAAGYAATDRIQKAAGLTQERGVATFLRMTGVLSPLADLIPKYAAAQRAAATAADRHTTALLAERQAVDSLKDALAGEQSAELEVRQAKLNVASAQARLTDLTKTGQRGSLEYKQAQLDLKRAQIDLKQRTEEYKVAQQRATAATGGAMHAAQQAQPPYRKFGETAQTAGIRALVMGQQAREGIRLIPSKRVTVTATFGFNTPPGISMHDIVGRASGGYISGPGTDTSDSIPARLSKGEYVVRAKAVRAVGRDTMDWINGQGYAAGGPVLDARISSAASLLRVVDRFEGAINRAIGRLADRFDRFAGARPPHTPGGWRVATQFLAALGIPYSIMSTFRPGARTHATGAQSYHALNRAVDLSGPNMLAIWSALTRTDPTELIYSRAPRYKSRRGWRPIGALDPITRADHFSHVHAAYDNGGFLMPGRTLAVNRTGSPEVVMPLGKLSGVFRDNLRSWVVPWLKRIAVGVEGHGGGGYSTAAVTRAGGVMHRAATTRSGRLTAQQLVRLSDNARRAYVQKYGLPKAPPGNVWAEDFTYVPTSFYDAGGWLMPGTTVATNSTGRPERVLPPGHGGGDIHVIVDLRGSTVLGGTGEIAARLAPELRTRIRDAQRRAGVPAAQQLR